jgi:BarA-like signal transduction histidine kinase
MISAFLGYMSGFGVSAIVYDIVLYQKGVTFNNNLNFTLTETIIVKGIITTAFLVLTLAAIIYKPKEVIQCSDAQNVEEVSESTKSVT